MVNFKEIYHFSRFKRGSNIFQGVQLFPGGGGGSNCLFPIETQITCDFPGGGGGGRDFFWCPQGPLSQWDLGDFFPNLKKNYQSQKNKQKNVFFFFFFRIFIQSPHTHTHKLHDDNLLELNPIFLQFNGNGMCNS